MKAKPVNRKLLTKNEMKPVQKRADAAVLVNLYLSSGYRHKNLAQKANLLFMREFMKAVKPEFQDAIQQGFVELQIKKNLNFEGISNFFIQIRKHNREVFKSVEAQRKIALGLLTNFGVA